SPACRALLVASTTDPRTGPGPGVASFRHGTAPTPLRTSLRRTTYLRGAPRCPGAACGGGRDPAGMSDDVPEITYEYVRIADLIAADIAAGRLPVGARLPGEQELAELHGVSVSTSRRVRRELVRRGLVTVLPAKGSFVARAAVEGGNDETPPPGQ